MGEEPVPGPQVVEVDVPDEAPVTGEVLPLPEEPELEEQGPAPSPCEGVPSVSQQQLAAFEAWSHQGDKYVSCFASAPDGVGGALVLRSNGVTFEIATRSGSSLTWYNVNTFVATAQPGGMLGIVDPNPDIPQWLLFVDGPTAYARQQPNEAAELVMTSVDPTGGLRAVLADGTLKAYDVRGETRWSIPISLSAPVSAVGVDALGHTLVLAAGDTRFGPATVEGRWVDSDGKPGPSFLALARAPAGSFELMPQAKEGLFLAVTQGARTWEAAFESLKPEASPAPAWLAQGAERPLLRLPGGKGYFRPSVIQVGYTRCERQAEIVSPAGASCGTLAFPATSGDASYFCEHLMLGADGTVVEPLSAKYMGSPGNPGPDDPQPEYGLHCAVRYWPGLLQ